MSPELVNIINGIGKGQFNSELCYVYSLGMSFLRITLQLNEKQITGLNTYDK